VIFLYSLHPEGGNRKVSGHDILQDVAALAGVSPATVLKMLE